MARLELHQRLVVGDDALDQHLHAAAGRLRAVQARADHAGVVEDREVAFAQQRRQIDEAPVGQRIAVDVEQAAPASRRRGRLRDQLRRQRRSRNRRAYSGGPASVARRRRTSRATIGRCERGGIIAFRAITPPILAALRARITKRRIGSIRRRRRPAARTRRRGRARPERYFGGAGTSMASTRKRNVGRRSRALDSRH